MNKKVLVIDDDKRLLKSIRAALEKESYTVYTENLSEHGIDQFKKIEPDIVILDVVMPVVTGLDISRQIRKLGNTDNVKIIIYSKELTDLEEHFRSFGANFCLFKSEDHQELIQLLNKSF